ncbi:MAG: hypothetical protein HFG33_00635 [Bacilli bacterium]|nr:hypothetical protein [Bacilli bacterium]
MELPSINLEEQKMLISCLDEGCLAGSDITFILTEIVDEELFLTYLFQNQNVVTVEILDRLKTLDDLKLENLLSSVSSRTLRAYIIAAFKDKNRQFHHIESCSGDEEILFNIGMNLDCAEMIIKIISTIYSRNEYRVTLASLLTEEDILRYLNSDVSLARKCFMLRYCPYDELKIKFLDENRIIIPKYQIEGLIKSISSESIRSQAIEIEKDLIDNEETEEFYSSEFNMYDSLTDALPRELAHGLEIEMSGNIAKSLVRKGGYIFGFEIKDEVTVEEGIEFTSDKMYFRRKDLESIYSVCRYAKNSGLKPNYQCSNHFHFDASFLDCYEAWYYFLYIYTKVERILFIIANREGTTPRPFICKYAAPFGRRYSEIIEKIDQSPRVDDFIRSVKKISNKKADALNVVNIGSKDKNTVEIRIPNGDDDADIMIQNILLFGNMFFTARKLSRLPMSPDKYKLLHALDDATDEQEVLEIFLKMIFKEESNREIFRKRYFANRELFDSCQTEIKEEFKSFRLNPRS